MEIKKIEFETFDQILYSLKNKKQNKFLDDIKKWKHYKYFFNSVFYKLKKAKFLNDNLTMYYLINKTIVRIQSFMNDIGNNYQELTKIISDYLIPEYGKNYYNEKPSKTFSKEFISSMRKSLKNIEIICNNMLDICSNNNFRFSKEIYTIYLTYCFNNGLVKKRYYKEKKMDNDGQYLFWSRKFKFIFIPFPKDLKKIKKTLFDIIENKQVNEKELIYRAEINLSNERYIDKRMLDNCIYENGLIQEIYENWDDQI
ncbi:hypothetical protein [Malacoplasma iowae]|uniref:Uncharacterized protein n=1 Tax=Malacoplasma iowae 695 TaxID=1048830 RepID=A0A6P1LE37_MALIO|nr:hypothetical protein [Malacoplasma iowae]VEU62502.1 Uncharacterised protein [Mycoplasmopsis fermentans]QHG89739.1 hypothetical protein EER00_02420 [Malacoplasma iowae 695]WPL35466.1 hypothetical protein QX180_04005 [Malacoplasma iowae]WPL37023.1 hypothetical protein QX179_00885 [Malacoplasma iowae]WPL39137.1 hypothetical protein QX181_01210 [Malacoplasma iowae]